MAIGIPFITITLENKIQEVFDELILPSYINDILARDAGVEGATSSGEVGVKTGYADTQGFHALNSNSTQHIRISLYLKTQKRFFKVESGDDLFTLTKMLGVDGEIGSRTKTIFVNASAQSDQKKLGDLPDGVSDAIKKEYFNQFFMPGIKKHYLSMLSNPSFDDITKRVLKKWWEEENTNLFPNFLKAAKVIVADDTLNGGSSTVSVADKTVLKALNKNSSQTDIPIGPDFFTTIFNNPSNPNGYVLDILGFSEFLQVQLDAGFFSDTEEVNFAQNATLRGLEASGKAGGKIFADITTTALDIDTDLDDYELAALDQCGLISGLLHMQFGFHYYTQIADFGSPISGSGDSRIYAVGSVPTVVDGAVYNPNALINNCSINKKVKNMFNTTDTKSPHNMVKGVFWVYEDNKDELREAEISTNSTVHRKKISKILFDMMDDIDSASLEDLGRFDKFEKQKDSSYYFLENTKITFDGTNPSTARNDVKVEMTWKLGSLEGLNSNLAILGPSDGIDTDTVITIKDLITLPLTKKPSASDGPGQFITNQYSPNYSRLRLKVAPYGDQEASHQSDCMILDLAIIDHQISRSSETGETTLTISYRGYFEAMLNMPFNDALAYPETIANRQMRQEESLNKLMENDCKPELIREAIRMEQAVFADEQAKATVAGSIIMRMQVANLIHGYILDQNKMRGGTFGGLLDGRKEYVKNVSPMSNTTLQYGASFTAGDIENKFIFLGDLMYVLLDCLFEQGTANHRQAVKNLNLRFIVGTINVPNPKDLGGPPLVINPISIPIDLKFFIEWFNATIVDKGITSYPVGTFIRDLVGRLVNDIIYETCFSLLLPDENPPLLRTTSFTSSEPRFFKKHLGVFDPTDPFQDGTEMDILFPKRFISAKDEDSNSWSQKVKSTNYCVIYQQFPSYKRQLAAQRNGLLRDDEYTPTLYYGAKNKNYNFLSNVSFAKTNSPYLREARYFNTNYGGLSLLSNVYDLEFSFKKRKANTMLYPGCIINFALLDWGKRWVDEPPWRVNADGSISHYFETGGLGESDPHVEGTMSNIMGMGGYFIVKSVEYNLGETPGEFEIKITTKFLGTDATKVLNRVDGATKQIEDKAVCVDIHNDYADRVNETQAVVNAEATLALSAVDEDAPTADRVALPFVLGEDPTATVISAYPGGNQVTITLDEPENPFAESDADGNTGETPRD